MTTKVVKIQIVKPLDSTWGEFGKVLRDLQYQSWKIANKTIQMLWDYSNFKFSYKERHGEWLDLKKNLLPSPNNEKGYLQVISDIRNQLKEEHKMFFGDGVSALLKMVEDKWKSDYQDVINGRKSIVSFKRNLPIELSNTQLMDDKRTKNIQLFKENGCYSVALKLISKAYVTELEREQMAFKVALAVKDDYQKAIVDRVMNKEYKLSMSKLIYDTRKKKWFLNLAYTFKAEKAEGLDLNKIMGIDLGVNVPATLAIHGDKYYKQFVGTKEEIEDFRRQIEARKRRIQRATKWSGDGMNGHGRKAKLQATNKIRDKIARFKNTKNDNWSKFVVNEALKKKCGVIQMEDLTGIATYNVFLKNWSYYKLQEKIESKAEEKGIKVQKIDPAYTSARCNECGYIHKDENKKEWRPSQSQFICQSCEYKGNADINAAKNIATPYIDMIIKKEIEEQGILEERELSL